MMKTDWECVLALDAGRRVSSGSFAALAGAVRRGADVRCYTTFDYDEHMAAPDARVGLVQEMMNFPLTYWLEGDHAAAIQTTRYPADCALGFQPYPSLSFFLYNDDGRFGIARPFLDGRIGKARLEETPGSKYHTLSHHDDETPCPSENATYEFGEYRWWVRDDWEEVLAHEADGAVTGGSLPALQEAFRAGREIKVGVRDLCAGLAPAGEPALRHEVLALMGPIYNHEEQGFLGGESLPLVRVAPAVPMRYASGNWNYGWILPRTDGVVKHLVVDPYTHQFQRTESRHPIRWFAR